MEEEKHYFGCCPECCKDSCDPKQDFIYCNIGRDHWFYCDKHQQAWIIGSNLFSGWREETEDVWEANFNKLCTYSGFTPENYGTVE